MSRSTAVSATIDLLEPEMIIYELGKVDPVVDVDREQLQYQTVDGALVGHVLRVLVVSYSANRNDGVLESGVPPVRDKCFVVVSGVLPLLLRHVEQIDEQDPERPHIAFEGVVHELGMDLRSSVRWRPCHSVTDVPHRSRSKVEQLEVTLRVDTAILKLDISMSDAV